ncbi:hypothetical protein HYC85_028450 [Camellia sinensis]|uniref:Reverse transcriptase zinc-binding domain-containing protein n=1 Tax=Camellia sinensis TaxID=4442 RepID=A0A7J7FVG5_CAMSI|nr:hypothetical protein HYC85_028450 [Camellia sinensis]
MPFGSSPPPPGSLPSVMSSYVLALSCLRGKWHHRQLHCKVFPTFLQPEAHHHHHRLDLASTTILVSVAMWLDRLQRDFLWGSGGDKFRYHLVDWRRICQFKQVGGSGVRQLVTFNKALLGKWLWRFALEQDRLWRRVIASKLGLDGVERFHWRYRFPLIFTIVVDREAMVVSYLRGGGVVVWDIQLRRQVQDWEVSQLVELWGFLYGLGLTGVGSDVMAWACVRESVMYVLCHCGVGGSFVLALSGCLAIVGFYFLTFWGCLGSTWRGVGYALGLAGCSDWTSTEAGVVVGAVLFDVACMVYLYGGQVTSWKNDHGQELLFVNFSTVLGFGINIMTLVMITVLGITKRTAGGTGRDRGISESGKPNPRWGQGMGTLIDYPSGIGAGDGEVLAIGDRGQGGSDPETRFLQMSDTYRTSFKVSSFPEVISRTTLSLPSAIKVAEFPMNNFSPFDTDSKVVNIFFSTQIWQVAPVSTHHSFGLDPTMFTSETTADRDACHPNPETNPLSQPCELDFCCRGFFLWQSTARCPSLPQLKRFLLNL